MTIWKQITNWIHGRTTKVVDGREITFAGNREAKRAAKWASKRHAETFRKLAESERAEKTMTNLAELPKEHPLRNTPLAEIHAEQRCNSKDHWIKITPGWNIAENCYNDLAPAWTDTGEFRAPQQPT